MLRFSLFGLPVSIHWFFWLICFLLGGGLSMQDSLAWIGIFVWTMAVLVSILVHECGHALVARRLGAWPSIFLHGLGGLTFLHGMQFPRGQYLLVICAGPLASLLLAMVFAASYYFVPPFSPVWVMFVKDGLGINIVWTIFNLLPVLPMDGGQILRSILGPKHLRAACVTGAIVAGLAAVWAFWAGAWFTGIILVFMAVGNYRGAVQLQGGVQ